MRESDSRDRTMGLGRALEKYLAGQRVLEASHEAMVPAIWGEVVGQWYALHTRVIRVWEGIVEVQCDSAARAQQLQLDSEEIMRRLNARLGATYVRQIRPSTGAAFRRHRLGTGQETRAYVSPAPSQAELDAIALPEAEERWIEQQGAAIQDERAREGFGRALRTHLKLRHWKLEHGWQQCSRCGELYDPHEGCLECRGR